MDIPARRDLMVVLTEISELAPFVRLGQLLTNLAVDVDAPWAGDVREVEDAELLLVAKDHLAALKRLPPESLADQIRGHLESDQYVQQAAG